MKLLGLILTATFCVSFMAQAETASPVSKMATGPKPSLKATTAGAPPAIPSEQFLTRKPAATHKNKKK